jgi:cysteine desulfurase/selenocysteine lyase
MTATEPAAGPLDAEAVRRDFPILTHQARGRPLVYLDNAATSQKPQSVIDALTHYYTDSNANVHRSVHYLAERATAAYETARARVAEFVNAPSPECVIWVRGTTEAINLVATAWGEPNVGEGDVILGTEMEHHSNLVPWQMLAGRTGAQLAHVKVTDEGRLDLEDADRHLAAKPRLFAFTAKSNVLGTENPVADLCAKAREVGAVTVVDGAQALPHGPLDFQALGCDFLAFSAHKALGPMGVGALVVRPERLEEMQPYQGGGEMILKVELQKSTFKDAPLKFEAGTPSVGDAVGFHTALDYLDALGPEAVHAHEARLTRLALDELTRLNIRCFGPDDADERAGIVSFEVPGVHPHDVAQLLDGDGVAVRAGHHCCQPLMRRFGVLATARASFYVYNTEDDVHALVRGLGHVVEYFTR